MTVNHLRQRLRSGPALLGTFVKLPGLEVIDCLAQAGFDFAVLDLEHSQIDERAAFDQLAYGRALGLPCLVRLPAVDAGRVGRLLEAGAAGIQVADVRSRAEAAALVRAARFPPQGDRGLSTSHRVAGYGALAAEDYVRAEPPLLVVQIEAETDDPLDELLTTGVDVCFAGPMDLSASLGLPGRTDDPLVLERIAAIAAEAAEAGVAFGRHLAGADGPAAAARYLTVGTDLTALLGGLRTLARSAR